MFVLTMQLAGKRIVIIVRNLTLGGAERQAANLANGLVELHGCDVRVWSFNAGDEIPPRLTPSIPVRVLHPGPSSRKALRLFQLARFVMALRAERPSFLIPFTDYPNKVVGATWTATGAQACVWNQRDEGREVTRSQLEGRAIRKVSWFVANSGAGRQHLEQTFDVAPERITVIPNGVDLAPPVAGRNEWRARLDIPESTPAVLMIANLHRFKDHLTLLRAFSPVVERLDDRPVLLLAGHHGNTSRIVSETISDLGLTDSVRLLGKVDDVSGLLTASDLVVHSSRREGCPNSVLEAMAAGLPIVATDIIGIREALGEDHPGLVPQNDDAALAEAIGTALLDRDKARAQGANNRQRSRVRFSTDAMTRSWSQLLTKLSTTSS